MSIWQDSTGKVIFAKPIEQFEPGVDYCLRIKTSYINGDTIMDSEARIRIHDLLFVNIENVLLKDTSNLSFSMTGPSQGVSFVKYGDSMPIYSITSLDSLVFSYFQIISSNNDTSYIFDSSFELVKDCDELDDITVRACYRIKDTMNLTLDTTTGSYTSVYDRDYNYLGGAGSYNIAPDDFVIINLDSLDDGKEFDGFSTNKISVNYRNLGNIHLYNKGNIGDITIKPDIDDTPEPPYHRYQVDVILDDVKCIYQLTDIFYGSELAWGQPKPTPPNQLDLKHPSVVINPNYSDNLGIYKMVVQRGTNSPEETIFDIPLSYWSQSMTATNPWTTITLYIRPITTFEITVETELIKYTSNSIAEIGKDKDVWIRVEILDCTGKPIKGSPFSNHNSDPFTIPNLQSGYKVFVNACGNANPGNSNYGGDFDFLNWDVDDGHYFSYQTWNMEGAWVPLTDNTSSSFCFKVTEDAVIKGVFKENFRIERIGVYRNDEAEPIWYSLRELRNLEKELGYYIDEIDTKRYDSNPIIDDGYLTEILIDFNNEPSPDLTPNFNIFSLELSDRVDLKGKNGYIAKYANNLYFDDYDNTLMKFYLKRENSNFDMIPKGMHFDLRLNDGIKDIWGNALKLRYAYKVFNLYTELPGLITNVVDVKVKEGSDGIGDWFYAILELGAYVDPKIINKKTNSIVWPPEDTPLIFLRANIEVDDTYTFNTHCITYWEMKKFYSNYFEIISYDGDCSIEQHQFGIENNPDKLGHEFFEYPWEEFWWGASPKVKHLRNSIWKWDNDYLRYKGEVKLKKQEEYFPNGNDPTY